MLKSSGKGFLHEPSSTGATGRTSRLWLDRLCQCQATTGRSTDKPRHGRIEPGVSGVTASARTARSPSLTGCACSRSQRHPREPSHRGREVHGRVQTPCFPGLGPVQSPRSHRLGTRPRRRPRSGAVLRSSVELIEAAQEPDGYINSYVQVVEKGRRFGDPAMGHELYCAGHLFQAAVADARTAAGPAASARWQTGSPRCSWMFSGRAGRLGRGPPRGRDGAGRAVPDQTGPSAPGPSAET